MNNTTRSLVLTTKDPAPVAGGNPATLVEHIIGFFDLILRQGEQDREILSGKRPRGRPPTLSWSHLWLVLLTGTLRQKPHLSMIWRILRLETVGSFFPVRLTYEAVRKRLLKAGTEPLQELFVRVSAALATWAERVEPTALSLASFAKEIVALDESTLDALQRLTQDLRERPAGDAHLLPGKLAGLFDLRKQRWMRLQFRADVLAGCNVGLLWLLQGLPVGSLILADLGYFSFPWFDYLTEQGYFWISRLKERVSYDPIEVFAYDDHTGMLDALVWLGKYRADRAGNAVRLILFSVDGKSYQYLSNVLDPRQLSMLDIAQLYARRWDIELAFKLLKRELGLCIWWGASPAIVHIQLWIALILAQVLHALQLHVALQAQVEPFEVSLHLLVELLGLLPVGPTPVIERLIQEGRDLGLLRPSRRLCVKVPDADSHRVAPSPHLHRERKARYAGRNPHPRTGPFVSSFQTQWLL